jgi:N-acetyl-anhydromuramyl-L-alanine amidase AmpD
MRTYTRRTLNVVAHRWLKKPLLNRGRQIVGVTLHSTRSGVRDGDDGPRTERWAANPQNRAKDVNGNPLDWGSFQDVIIFEDGTQVICTNWEREFPSWCAGKGSDPNTWAMSDNYVQIEIGQGQLDEPFTAAAIDSTAQLVAAWAHQYGFPIQRIPFVTQVGAAPKGITTHEDCANGRYYGKSDPGPMFPWPEFLAKAQAYYDGETDMVSREEFEQFKAETIQRYIDDHDWLAKLDARMNAIERRIETMDMIDAHWRQQHEECHRPPVLE